MVSRSRLAYQVYSERGELEYLNSNFERAEYFVRQAIGNTDSLLDKASLYTQWVQQATLNADYQKAVNVARVKGCIVRCESA